MKVFKQKYYVIVDEVSNKIYTGLFLTSKYGLGFKKLDKISYTSIYMFSKKEYAENEVKLMLTPETTESSYDSCFNRQKHFESFETWKEWRKENGYPIYSDEEKNRKTYLEDKAENEESVKYSLEKIAKINKVKSNLKLKIKELTVDVNLN